MKEKKLKKEVICYFNDSDFGEVPVYFYPEINAISADSLFIYDIPLDLKQDMIELAWDTFRFWYNEFGTMMINYDQIPTLDKMIRDYEGL